MHSLVISINTVVLIIATTWEIVVASDDGLLLDAGTMHHIFTLPTFLNDGR